MKIVTRCIFEFVYVIFESVVIFLAFIGGIARLSFDYFMKDKTPPTKVAFGSMIISGFVSLLAYYGMKWQKYDDDAIKFIIPLVSFLAYVVLKYIIDHWQKYLPKK